MVDSMRFTARGFTKKNQTVNNWTSQKKSVLNLRRGGGGGVGGGGVFEKLLYFITKLHFYSHHVAKSHVRYFENLDEWEALSISVMSKCVVG